MTGHAATPVETQVCGTVLTVTLANEAARNALSTAMFDALERAVAEADSMARTGAIDIVVIRARGRAFCAGFDLAEAVAEPALLGTFVHRLGAIVAAIRALDAIVVAAVQGPALAGGCAIVAACDIVCASRGASFGYPVHRIGVSPAVSLPTLMATCGPGAARILALSGEIVDASRALELGLVHRLAEDEAALDTMVRALAMDLAAKGPHALRETKRWLNRIDGTAPSGALGARAQAATRVSAQSCEGDEARTLLASYWASRSQGRKG